MDIRAEIYQNGRSSTVCRTEGARLTDLVSVSQPCGGKGTCGRCRVLAVGALSPVTAEERKLLTDHELEEGWRLACAARALGDVEIRLPQAQVFDQISQGEDGHIRPVEPIFSRYGLAVDIGTTTVAARLFSMDGPVMGVGMKNPQTAYGADVISRIEQAIHGREGPLTAAIRRALATIMDTLCEKCGISAQEVTGLVVTGNTTMLYLLTGRNPVSLSAAPFAADYLFGEFMSGAELELPGTARVYFPRCVSAFVGADITTAILASGMAHSVRPGLLVDLGTNGELALWHGGQFHCCSTAAGPAFEGVGIHMGVYSVRGAIDKVWIDEGKICYSTIGDEAAVGICGSGIVDALAVMLEAEVIDETGAFCDNMPAAYADYILETENGPAFHIGGGIIVTGADVRSVQLAKGSIRAGMETLLDAAGVAKSELDVLYIAGGFGSFINIASAVSIGLIPEELAGKVKILGNAAQVGAAMLLCDQGRIAESEVLARQGETVHLEANPVFTEHYINHMLF
ncbi:MAG: ASKHA domain-containing protein [Oscillospiraceae bacterium]|nr:ASKHA domain-containing protein [Oscillospiraceae bacterium]